MTRRSVSGLLSVCSTNRWRTSSARRLATTRATTSRAHDDVTAASAAASAGPRPAPAAPAARRARPSGAPEAQEPSRLQTTGTSNRQQSLLLGRELVIGEDPLVAELTELLELGHG